MKWFKHDSNANTDAKLKKLRHKYGITGYGIYWYCLELIAGKVDKTNITFELEEDAETIALEWNIDQLKVQEIMAFMCKLRLFENNNGAITCFKLALRLDDTNAKNPEIKGIVNKIKENNSGLVGETPNMSDQTRLDKTRLDKTRKDKNTNVDKSTTNTLKKEIEEVFNFWIKTMEKTVAAKLTKERRKKISDRLNDGYSVDRIKTAIIGCSVTPHNMGKNENNKRYDDIELICRNGNNLERFESNATELKHEASQYSSVTQRNIQNTEGDW